MPQMDPLGVTAAGVAAVGAGENDDLVVIGLGFRGNAAHHCKWMTQGTTTNGRYLLPFRTGAFLAGSPVQPVVLRYHEVSSLQWPLTFASNFQVILTPQRGVWALGLPKNTLCPSLASTEEGCSRCCP